MPDLAGQVVNLGHDHECSLIDLAELIKRLRGAGSPIVFRPLPEDDPKRRRPDLTKARRLLWYEPRVSLEDGLRRTIAWCVESARHPASADERETGTVQI